MSDMSELAREIDAIGRESAYRILANPQNEFLDFRHLLVGSQVLIDLLGETCDGIPLERDRTIRGTLMDDYLGIVDVADAEGMPDLEGRQIGLAVCADLGRFRGLIVRRILRGHVKPLAGAAYFLPEAVPAGANYDIPAQEDFHPLGCRYGRVVVGHSTIFDAREVDARPIRIRPFRGEDGFFMG